MAWAGSLKPCNLNPPAFPQFDVVAQTRWLNTPGGSIHLGRWFRMFGMRLRNLSFTRVPGDSSGKTDSWRPLLYSAVELKMMWVLCHKCCSFASLLDCLSYPHIMYSRVPHNISVNDGPTTWSYKIITEPKSSYRLVDIAYGPNPTYYSCFWGDARVNKPTALPVVWK